MQMKQRWQMRKCVMYKRSALVLLIDAIYRHYYFIDILLYGAGDPSHLGLVALGRAPWAALGIDREETN